MLAWNKTDKEFQILVSGTKVTFPANPSDRKVDSVVEIGNENVFDFINRASYVPGKRLGVDPGFFRAEKYQPKSDESKCSIVGRYFCAARQNVPKSELPPQRLVDPKDAKAAMPTEQRIQAERLENMASLPASVLKREVVRRGLASKNESLSRNKMVDLLKPTDYYPPTVAVDRDNPLTSAVAEAKGFKLPSQESFDKSFEE